MVRASDTNPHGIVMPTLSAVVVDRIRDCRAKNTAQNNLAALELVVIHRISLAIHDATWNPAPIADAYLDAMALAFRFGFTGSPTKGAVPYHLLLKKDGACEQLLPLQTRGSHAIGVNSKSIGLAVAFSEGDELTDAQKVALPFVLAGILPLGYKGLQCAGHTEIPGASADPKKICPNFSWREYEHAARAMLPVDVAEWSIEKREAWVASKGFVLARSQAPLVA